MAFQVAIPTLINDNHPSLLKNFPKGILVIDHVFYKAQRATSVFPSFIPVGTLLDIMGKKNNIRLLQQNGMPI
jgi:hypothetical protein